MQQSHTVLQMCLDRLPQPVSHYRHILATMQHGAENAVVQHYAGIDRRLGIARLSFSGHRGGFEKPSVIPGQAAFSGLLSDAAEFMPVRRQATALPPGDGPLRDLGDVRHLGLREIKDVLADVQERIHA